MFDRVLDVFSNEYVKNRIDKIRLLKENKKNPYNNQVQRELTCFEFHRDFARLKQEESENRRLPDSIFWLVGRVKFIRMMGRACFANIEDESASLQIYISFNDLGQEFDLIKKTLEVGDFISVRGYPFVTKTGELSLHVLEYQFLTKSIIPLPEKFHGLTDIEICYRQRYLDLIVNTKTREIFKLRSRVVAKMRRFFEDKGFLEVETPMLHPIPGGANARPFVTHHNTLDVEFYLRIAPELYLKRLIVGGFEAVFEINRNFRNEGMDHSHNPEFTMIEFYWAYKTYEDLILLTQELFSYLLRELNIPEKVEFSGEIVDFSDFRVISYKNAISQIGGVDKDVLESKDKLQAYLLQKGLIQDANISYGKLLSCVFEALVEPKLINPTFVTEYPIDISPLARRNDKDNEIADRFELFIGGREIANGFSELNDPQDQFQRFKEQVLEKDAGDEEAQYMDEDYVVALGYGMPPTAGQGIGIDRLVMLLSGAKSIKDVILFPSMRPHVN